MCDRPAKVAGTLIQFPCASALEHQQLGSAFSQPLLWEAQALTPLRTCTPGKLSFSLALAGLRQVVCGGFWLSSSFIISFFFNSTEHFTLP